VANPHAAAVVPVSKEYAALRSERLVGDTVVSAVGRSGGACE